jgi:D-amino-acid dehydrogenase
VRKSPRRAHKILDALILDRLDQPAPQHPLGCYQHTPHHLEGVRWLRWDRWAPDLLKRHGIALPFAVNRGYHRHFGPSGNAGLARPILDADIGYCLAPMEQGIRLTTGVEFADRDAPQTPVQLERATPAATALFPLGDPVEDKPWMGARPCFADSRPVIGRAPGQPGLWLACGHGHSGLTLGPATAGTGYGQL